MKIILNKPNVFKHNNRLMNMGSKEKWIEDVLNSTTSIESVNHNPFLYRKTMNAISEQQPQAEKKQWAIPAFGCIAVLIFCNSFIIYNYQDTTSIGFEEEDISLIMNEYSLNEEEVSLYEF